MTVEVRLIKLTQSVQAGEMSCMQPPVAPCQESVGSGTKCDALHQSFGPGGLGGGGDCRRQKYLNWSWQQPGLEFLLTKLVF